MSITGSGKVTDMPMQMGYGSSIQLMSLVQQLKSKALNLQAQIDTISAEIITIDSTLVSLQSQITALPDTIWQLVDQNGSASIQVDTNALQAIATGGLYIQGPTATMQMTTGVGTILQDSNQIEIQGTDGDIQLGAGVFMQGSAITLQGTTSTITVGSGTTIADSTNNIEIHGPNGSMICHVSGTSMGGGDTTSMNLSNLGVTINAKGVFNVDIDSVATNVIYSDGTLTQFSDNVGSPFLTMNNEGLNSTTNMVCTGFANSSAGSELTGELMTWDHFVAFYNTMYPIGSLIQSLNATPPTTYGGYVTWLAYGIPVLGVYTYQRTA